MKWIRHMTIANKDDKLVSLRANFGMWGIGVYWTLVELVAEQITEKSDKAVATLVIPELLGLLGCKRNKLDSFLEHSENVSLMKTVVNGNLLQLDIPKILDFADNYIKYDGKSLKTLQRQVSVSTKQDKNRIDKSTTCTYDFELLWKRYPKPIGKRDALKHFNSSVKTDEDWKNINIALDNYLKTENVIKGNIQYIKHGSTWFNNWQDYVSITVTQKQEPVSGLSLQMQK